MNEENDFALVRRPPSALEKAEPRTKRILSGMVADTLALAKTSESKGPPVKVDYVGKQTLGKCPRCGGRVFESETEYLCEKSQADEKPCKFRIRTTVAQRRLEREHLVKLLATGKTDLLERFIAKSGRVFSARLVVGKNGKIAFEFPPRLLLTPVTTPAAARNLLRLFPEPLPPGMPREAVADYVALQSISQLGLANPQFPFSLHPKTVAYLEDNPVHRPLPSRSSIELLKPITTPAAAKSLQMRFQDPLPRSLPVQVLADYVMLGAISDSPRPVPYPFSLHPLTVQYLQANSVHRPLPSRSLTELLASITTPETAKRLLLRFPDPLPPSIPLQVSADHVLLLAISESPRPVEFPFSLHPTTVQYLQENPVHRQPPAKGANPSSA